MALNKKMIDSLSLPQANKSYSKIFHDDKQNGLALRVTSNGAKTFIINKKMNGKVIRMNVGGYGAITLDEARKKASKMLGQIAEGIDPLKEKNALRKNITLQAVFDDYLLTRKTLKPKSKQDYESIMRSIFSEWVSKPLISITREMVVRLHHKIGEKSPARANNAFKLLGALFNFALYQYQNEKREYIFQENPVICLTQQRAWYKKKRRTTKIDNHDLPRWFDALTNLRCQNFNSIETSVRYYLILLLFTGLRKEEAAQLVWADARSRDKAVAKTEHILDLKNKTIFIPDPKNSVEHWLPLPDYLYDLFKENRIRNSSRYVFPGAGSSGSYIKEPRKVMDKIIKETGIKFTLHDLRRTFTSIANEAGVPVYTLKRLLNHKSGGSDVTAGYVISDLNYLKEPMQKIAHYILELIAKKDTTH